MTRGASWDERSFGQQITSALRPREAGTPVVAVSQIETSEATFYIWKKTYANLGIAELRELRQLRDGITRRNAWWRIRRISTTLKPLFPG